MFRMRGTGPLPSLIRFPRFAWISLQREGFKTAVYGGFAWRGRIGQTLARFARPCAPLARALGVCEKLGIEACAPDFLKRPSHCLERIPKHEKPRNRAERVP